MQRLRKTKTPCSVCGLHLDRCICSQIKKMDLATRIVLIVHNKELKRTSNSGRLAIQALSNSEMIVRGQDDKEKEPEKLDLSYLLNEKYESLLFFPADNATELTAEFVAKIKKPIQLLVPDGNWRQAAKVNTRHPEIAHIKRVMLKIPNTAKHHLRTEHNEFGMSTLEAIARAIGAIEGAESEKILLDLYNLKLAQTLKGRGIKSEIS